MTPPETCPRCGAERSGVQENLVLFACGSIFMRDKVGFTVVEPAKCKSGLMEEKQLSNPLLNFHAAQIEPEKATSIDILLEVKRDTWRRGAEAMRNEIAITLGKFQNADDMTVVADDVRNIQTPRYFDV